MTKPPSHATIIIRTEKNVFLPLGVSSRRDFSYKAKFRGRGGRVKCHQDREKTESTFLHRFCTKTFINFTFDLRSDF